MLHDPLSFGRTHVLLPDEALEDEFRVTALDPKSDLGALLKVAEVFPREVLNNPGFALGLAVDSNLVMAPAVADIGGAAALAQHVETPDTYLEMALRSSEARVVCGALANPRMTPQWLERAFHSLRCETVDVVTSSWGDKPISAAILRRLPLERARELAGTNRHLVAAVLSRDDQEFEGARRYLERLVIRVPEGERSPHHALLSHPDATGAFFEDVLAKPHWLDWSNLARYAPAYLLDSVVRLLLDNWSAASSPWMGGPFDYEARKLLGGWRRAAYWLVQRQAELTPQAIGLIGQLHFSAVVLYFAQNPDTPNHVLQAILENARQAGGGVNNHEGALLAMIVAHPNFVLGSPIRTFGDAASIPSRLVAVESSDAAFVLGGVACNPRAPRDLVAELLERGDDDAWYAIGQIARGSLHPGVRAVALGFEGHPAQDLVFASSYTPSYELERGASSASAEARLAIAHNPNTPTSTLLKLKEDRDPEVAKAARLELFNYQLFGRPLPGGPVSTVPDNHPELAL